jgi:hypothetical protein
MINIELSTCLPLTLSFILLTYYYTMETSNMNGGFWVLYIYRINWGLADAKV